jgi:uncharacterized protein YecT (DUF1311 family)
MPADRFGEPWSGTTYNGFSGPGPTPRPRRGLSRGAIIGAAAAAAVALGLASGFAFRPDQRALALDDPKAEARVATPMPIRVDPPAPPSPLPKPAGKLEVLNPATAEAARAAQPTWTSAATPRTAAVAQPVSQTDTAARSDPQARCAGAASRAEALVCADPQLAAYDRDLDRAYRRALRSGAVSPDDLRADQRDWLDDRERAARHSPAAIADLYAQRIDELNRIADDGPE